MISRILSITEIIGTNSSAFLFGARGTGKTVLAKKWLETEHTRGFCGVYEIGLFLAFCASLESIY